MEIISVGKFIRMSPKKIRPISLMVKKFAPERAVTLLSHIHKSASEPLSKVLKTALANAKVKGVSPSDLTIKEIQINEGPRLKRGRPVSRGRWHPYKRRMSHIRVVLEAKEGEKLESKGEKE